MTSATVRQARGAGMGERTTPQAVLWIARSLFRAGSARLVLAVHLPKSRSYIHLATNHTISSPARSPATAASTWAAPCWSWAR
jgi:arginine deiminase